MLRKTITFAEKPDEWLKFMVEQGHYKDESDYVRDLVRKDQAAKAEVYETISAIEAGYKSGISKNDLNGIWAQALKEVKEEIKHE